MAIAGPVLLTTSVLAKVAEQRLASAPVCTAAVADGCVAVQPATVKRVYTTHAYRGGTTYHLDLTGPDGAAVTALTLAYDADPSAIFEGEEVNSLTWDGSAIAIDPLGDSPRVLTDSDPGTRAANDFMLGMAFAFFLPVLLIPFPAARTVMRRSALTLVATAVPSVGHIMFNYGIGVWLGCLLVVVVAASTTLLLLRPRLRATSAWSRPAQPGGRA